VARSIGVTVLFDGAARTNLKLAGVTRIGPDGVTIQRYKPARA